MSASTEPDISQLFKLGVMDDLGPDVLQPMFAQLAASPKAKLRSVGLAGQIKQSIPAAVTTLAAIEFGTLPVDAQDQISNAVCEYRNTDISGILALSSLLSPKFSASVNSCAAYALREVHSREALPTLRKLLDSNSAVTRYDAVIGIAKFAMGFPIVGSADKPAVMGRFSSGTDINNEMRQNYPAINLFSQDEQKYISYWKAWLASNLSL